MHLKLIDGSALLQALLRAQRAGAAAPAPTARAGPEPSPPLAYPVLCWFKAALRREPHALHVVLWDGRAEWRHQMLDGYCANGQTQRLRIAEGLPALKTMLQHLPVVQLMHPGAEAADLAWGLGQVACSGHFTELVTDDTAWQQQVSPPVVWQGFRRESPRVELSRFKGLAPLQSVCEVKALAGDTSRSVAGVPGLSPPQAGELLERYGSLRRLLEVAADPFAFNEEPRWAKRLALASNVALVKRNESLLKLALGPALRSQDVSSAVGVLDEIELMGMLESLDTTGQLDDSQLCFDRLAMRPARSDVLSLLRCMDQWQERWRT